MILLLCKKANAAMICLGLLVYSFMEVNCWNCTKITGCSKLLSSAVSVACMNLFHTQAYHYRYAGFN